MTTIDHHLHTSRHSPDSLMDPSELIERARRLRLDVVVITDHDFLWPADELEELNRQPGSPLILSGAEVSAREGHFLVYGLPRLDDVPPGVELKDLLAVVRRHQAAIVAAHPFRWQQDFSEIVRQHGPAFDALELVSNNVTLETRRLTERLLREHPMGATGSSDAHHAEHLGCYFTEFPVPIRSMADFVSALKGRLGRPRSRPGSPLTSGPVERCTVGG
jgi:predicted metal-dependent phosphoesterase TrpH